MSIHTIDPNIKVHWDTNEMGEPIIKITNPKDPNFDPSDYIYVQQQGFDELGEVEIRGIVKRRKAPNPSGRNIRLDHPVFGAAGRWDKISTKYSMVFQVGREPELSKPRYDRYWRKLIYKVDRFTNAIYIRRGTNIELVTQKKQLVKTCGTSLRMYQPFHQEMLDKAYMKEWVKDGLTYFVFNPLYVRNGNPLAQVVYDLFND